MNASDKTFSYNELKEKLAGAGIKVTHQRIVIYEALWQLNNHPSAEQIYEYVKPNNPSISLGTVYKTLDTFVNTGLCDKVLSPEGQQRYDANMDYHNHIYCTNTKEIIDFEDAQLDEIIQAYFKKKNINNFNIKDIRIQISGSKNDPGKEIKIT
ncbi:transcriptional repressor [Cytophagaceae bacterium ABcell3]|nr:transcriptional repressor [Cytophagaceae bacterium ABcell3]